MSAWKIAVATQTPLVRALRGQGDELVTVRVDEATGTPSKKSFDLNPGGVGRMVLDTVRMWTQSGHVSRADWFSLQHEGARVVEVGGLPLRLHHLSLAPDEREAYARTKEKIWAHIHGAPAGPFDVDDFRFYSRYNWFTADAMLQHAPDMDAAYVHDFQLLQTGALLGLAAPSVLRWHVPFHPSIIPQYTRNFLVRLMEDFDSTIVSTQRDYQGLLAAGYRGSVHQIYPHINPKEWPAPSPSAIQAFEDDVGLKRDDPVLLCVARMDPMKAQDVAIRAMRSVRLAHPRARLVLVGNGSFSSSRGAGLGLPKATLWSTELQALVAEQGLRDAVTFAHWIPDNELSAAYARADLVLLPSRIEGFGLTVLEGWRHQKPCIVSSGAGAAEIIQEGENGLTFPSGDAGELAAKISLTLSNRGRLEFMGQAAAHSMMRYSVTRAAPKILQVLEETIDRFGAANAMTMPAAGG